MATFSTANFSQDAKVIISAAQNLADQRKHKNVLNIHLLSAFLDKTNLKQSLTRANINIVKVDAAVKTALSKISAATSSATLSDQLIDVLKSAETISKEEKVSSGTLFIALCKDIRGDSGTIISTYNISNIVSVQNKQGATAKVYEDMSDVFLLDCVNDSRKFQKPIIGRSQEVRRIISILERREKNNPLLVGFPGIGKKSIINAIALRISEGKIPSLKNVRLQELDVGSVISGLRMKGEIEERINKIISKVKASKDDIVIVVNGLEQLFFGQFPIGEMLRPAIESDVIRIIATVTTDDLKKIEEKFPITIRLFTQIAVEEPSEELATDIVRGYSSKLEEHHHVPITEGAIVSSVKFAKRYIHNVKLPESAIDLIDESLSSRRMKNDGLNPESDTIMTTIESLKTQAKSLENVNDEESVKRKNTIKEQIQNLVDKLPAVVPEAIATSLTANDVAETLAIRTGIPVSKMLESEAEKLRSMEIRLSKRVIGQDDAIKATSKAVRRSRVGLRDPKKPIGSFLFLGPSGVGKTELAKALAEFLFDDEQAMTRLDMSEFGERHMAQRLIGSPFGYADSEQGGFLTEAVRNKPFSVLLFDEVEKAHQDVFNLLLQVLDDGRLTDGRGRTATFQDCVVILTSNIGSKDIIDCKDGNKEDLKEILETELRKFFKPEFLNRIDDIVIFDPLGSPQLSLIADIQFNFIRKMISEQGFSLEVSDEAKDFMVQKSVSATLGARPLKREITKCIQDPIAEAILNSNGNKVVNVEIVDGIVRTTA